MSELPGTAAFGIEHVSWDDAGQGTLTVRVTGHWRRRRPAAGTPTMLVIEVEGQRHRFPALPEPPSLSAGASPGNWRLSFSVPARLAPELGGRVWLALGGASVPLPVPGSASAPASGPRDGAVGARELPPPPVGPEDPGRARRAEDAGRAAGDLWARVGELERELTRERAARERSERRERAGDLARRRAEQRAHAEEALRLDLAQQIAAGASRSRASRRALGDLAAAEERIRELELRLEESERAADEAERVAAAAQRRAETVGRGAGATAAAPDSETARLRFESELRDRASAAHRRVPDEPRHPAGIAGEPPSAPGADDAMIAALHGELASRARTEASLRARAVQAESRLATRVLIEQRTAATLRALQDELATLREVAAEERERRRAAELTARRAREERERRPEPPADPASAIEGLRESVERLRAPSSAPNPAFDPPADLPAPAGSPSVTPEALSDALARLRDATPAETPPPSEEAPEASDDAPPGPPPSLAAARPARLALAQRTPTIERAFGSLLGRDPELAGRLLLDLLGAQATVALGPIAYDLMLGAGHGVVQVTVSPRHDGGGAETETLHARVTRSGAARAREQVSFQALGDPIRLARRLRAGRLRRALPLGLARVRGSRSGFEQLRALLGLPLGLRALGASGAGLSVETALGLLAGAVAPGWTRGERFTLAFEVEGPPVYLQARDGHPLAVTRSAPGGRIAGRFTGPATECLAWLAGDVSTATAAVQGDRGPFAVLAGWARRAESA